MYLKLVPSIREKRVVNSAALAQKLEFVFCLFVVFIQGKEDVEVSSENCPAVQYWKFML